MGLFFLSIFKLFYACLTDNLFSFVILLLVCKAALPSISPEQVEICLSNLQLAHEFLSRPEVGAVC